MKWISRNPYVTQSFGKIASLIPEITVHYFFWGRVPKRNSKVITYSALQKEKYTMRVARYEPWNFLNQLYKDLDQMYARSAENGEETTVATSSWIPAVDIKEDEQRFLIHADIPGVDPKDIEITMEAGVLTIKGERESETTEERKEYKRVERSHGSFYRRFSLPDTADAEKISATGKHGVLEVVIPKRELAQPRKINVELS